MFLSGRFGRIENEVSILPNNADICPTITCLLAPYVHPTNKKGFSDFAKPLILLVPRDRIELPTRGFSVQFMGNSVYAVILTI
jgi:hypothetical protein